MILAGEVAHLRRIAAILSVHVFPKASEFTIKEMFKLLPDSRSPNLFDYCDLARSKIAAAIDHAKREG